MSACKTCVDSQGNILKLPPKVEELREAIRIKKNQNIKKNPINLLKIIMEYWSDGMYMLRKFGWRSFRSFWVTKLFVVDEGGELGLLNPFYRRWPMLLKKPFKFEIEHTTICDKKCFFCEHTHWSQKSTSVNFDYLKKVTDDMTELRWINITGEGSSFLNKDFMKTIEYLRKERHINVNFVDEMDFFDESISRKVIELGVNSVWISFDGATKETYERVKEGCDYDKGLENIKTLLRLKEEMKSPFPALNFRFIITRHNYHEMPAYMDLMDSLKNRGTRARVEFIGLLTYPGIEEHYFSIEEVPEEILVQTLEKALEYDINLLFSHEGAKLPSMSHCTAWAEPYVMIDGSVISCCALVMSNNREFLQENAFGNVNEKSYMEIWDSERFQNFRKQVIDDNAPVPATCYGCRAFDTFERAERCGVDDPIGALRPNTNRIDLDSKVARKFFFGDENLKAPLNTKGIDMNSKAAINFFAKETH